MASHSVSHQLARNKCFVTLKTAVRKIWSETSEKPHSFDNRYQGLADTHTEMRFGV